MVNGRRNSLPKTRLLAYFLPPQACPPVDSYQVIPRFSERSSTVDIQETQIMFDIYQCAYSQSDSSFMPLSTPIGSYTYANGRLTVYKLDQLTRH